MNIAGFEFPATRQTPAIAIVRVPVHRVAKVSDAAGQVLSPFNIPTSSVPLTNEKLNVSNTIVEWRIAAIVTLGCLYEGDTSVLCNCK